jgi:hypothetical protein
VPIIALHSTNRMLADSQQQDDLTEVGDYLRRSYGSTRKR